MMSPPAPPPPLRQFAAGSAMQGRPVTEDTPPDLLEGTMDLVVILPNRRRVNMEVHRSTPMMDLLIQVTTAHKISPAGHVIHVVSDSSLLTYKPSTPIGTLDASIIEIVPKNKLNDNTRSRTNAASKNENNQRLKPKQWVYKQQLVVNLPRQQLAVYRVPPDTPVGEVLQIICSDRELDRDNVQLRHPGKLDELLDPRLSLQQYGLHEVTLVPRDYERPPASLSVSDLLTMTSLARHQQEDQRTKRKGVFKFFSRKSKSSTGDSSLSSGSAGERSVSPTRSDESATDIRAPVPPYHNRSGMSRAFSSQTITQHNGSSNSTRPTSLHETSTLSTASSSTSRDDSTASSDRSSSVTVRSGGGADPSSMRPPSVVPPARSKKRKAPPAPPLQKPQANGKVPGAESKVGQSSNLSRRSSDSSGYHEPPDLRSQLVSPTESEVSGTDTSHSSRPTSDVPSVPSSSNLHSLQPQSNLTSVNSTSTSSIATTASMKNRRRAPMPPKVAPEPPRPTVIPEEESPRIRKISSPKKTAAPTIAESAKAVEAGKKETKEEQRVDPVVRADSRSSQESSEEPRTESNGPPVTARRSSSRCSSSSSSDVSSHSRVSGDLQDAVKSQSSIITTCEEAAEVSQSSSPTIQAQPPSPETPSQESSDREITEEKSVRENSVETSVRKSSVETSFREPSVETSVREPSVECSREPSSVATSKEPTPLEPSNLSSSVEPSKEPSLDQPQACSPAPASTG